MQKSFAGLGEAHACQRLNDRSVLNGKEDLMEAAKICLNGPKSGSLGQGLKIWDASRSLLSAQTVQ